MKPELGPQPQGSAVSRARLHEGQDAERAVLQAVHPLEKMALVWTDDYRGSSGTESLKGV